MKCMVLYLNKQGFPVDEPLYLETVPNGHVQEIIIDPPDETSSTRVEILSAGEQIIRIQNTQSQQDDWLIKPQNSLATHHGDVFVDVYPCYNLEVPKKKREPFTFKYSVLPLTREETFLTLVSAVEGFKILGEEKDAEYARLKSEFDGIYNSNAWRAVRVYYKIKDGIKLLLKSPKRGVAELGRWGYRHLPLPGKLKALIKQKMLDNSIFAGLSLSKPIRHSETELRNARQTFQPWDRKIIKTFPLKETSLTIAVHLHLFYIDMAELFFDRLSAIPFPFDLYISVSGQPESVKNTFAKLPHVRRLTVETVPNTGRDVAPLLVTYGQTLIENGGYDIILHLHSKRSTHHESGEDWLSYLLDSLLGNEEHIRRLIGAFEENEELGVLYPETHPIFPYWTLTTYTNEKEMRTLLSRLSVPFKGVYADFPVGTMFWARGSALEPLLSSGIERYDFPAEKGQLDGTIAHAVERSIGLISEHYGYKNAQISPDGLMMGRGVQNLDNYLATDAVKMNQYAFRFNYHVFDIFDTLVYSRFLTDIELFNAVEQEIQARFDKNIPFSILREKAEQQVRKNGRGYDIHTVYTVLKQLLGKNSGLSEKIKALEFEILKNSCYPREPIAKLFTLVKNPVISCDTIWPDAYLREILGQCGIKAEESVKFYLSNQLGFGKEDGRMYNYLKGCFRGQAFLNIGSHEQIDIAIPNQLEINAFHVMSVANMVHISGLEAAETAGLIRPENDYRNQMGANPFGLSGIMQSMQEEIAEAQNRSVHIVQVG